MKPIIKNLHVIGCGGVASYLLPVLLKTFDVKVLTLHDGDTLEARNLDRQLFAPEQIGLNKAEALQQLLSRNNQLEGTTATVVPEYFHNGTVVDSYAVLIVCVDNHAARVAALQVADMEQCFVVLAANEYTSSQSMVYVPEWRNTTKDPRVRYKEMLTDESDNPLRPESCQGAAQQKNSQLAMANFGAANFAMWVLWAYLVESGKLDEQIRKDYLPVEHSCNFNRFNTVLSKDVAA